MRIVLRKQIPVGAGLCGGSADAAAALRLLAKANNLSKDDKIILDAALRTGADVPACLHSKSALMHGIGENIRALALPACAAIMVNCGRPLLTRYVFAKFSLHENRPPKAFEPPENFHNLIAMLQSKANDLAHAARMLCPEIMQVERAVEGAGAALTRLSGALERLPLITSVDTALRPHRLRPARAALATLAAAYAQSVGTGDWGRITTLAREAAALAQRPATEG